MHAAISYAVWFSLVGVDCMPVGELIVPAARIRQPDRVEPYVPREGDFVFYDDRSVVWTPLFAMALMVHLYKRIGGPRLIAP